MRVDVLLTPNQTDEMALRDKTIVMIDILRASTSIITALKNGAREIIPVTTVEAAVKISGNLFGDVKLLAGERNGRMIEGFHLGNSPREFTEEKVKGKSVIFTSTNGAQALGKGRYARELAVCGFVNISMVLQFLRQTPRDFTIVCAGNNGAFSLEDSVCAGMLLHGLAQDKDLPMQLSDSAVASLQLHKALGKNILKMMKLSEHARYLEEIGFGDDLKVCAAIDTLPVLPQLEGNVLKLKRETAPVLS